MGITADDVILYDLSGTAVALIGHDPKGTVIFLSNAPYAGVAVAMITGTTVRGLNGNELGTYLKEVFYNTKNQAIGFTKTSFKGQVKPGPENFSKIAVPSSFADNARGFERGEQNPQFNLSSLEGVLKSGSREGTLN